MSCTPPLVGSIGRRSIGPATRTLAADVTSIRASPIALALVVGAALLSPVPAHGQSDPRDTTATPARDPLTRAASASEARAAQDRAAPRGERTVAPTVILELPPTAPIVTVAPARPALGTAADAIVRAPGTDSVRAIFAPRVRVRPPPPVRTAGRGIRPMAVAKWGSLASTLGAALYGFAASMGADDHYARIEEACREAVHRCRVSESNGRYVDPEVDGWAREAEKLDRRAQVGLLASQVGAAASVVLFILDLRDTGAPPNVPYLPSRLRVGVSAAGAWLGVRLSVP